MEGTAYTRDYTTVQVERTAVLLIHRRAGNFALERTDERTVSKRLPDEPSYHGVVRSYRVQVPTCYVCGLPVSGPLSPGRMTSSAALAGWNDFVFPVMRTEVSATVHENRID